MTFYSVRNQLFLTLAITIMASSALATIFEEGLARQYLNIFTKLIEDRLTPLQQI